MRQATRDALRDSLMNRTVLVIDDNEAVRTAFEVLLSIHGVRTLVAGSPGEGLATLAREPVHLVIQDMNFQRHATSGEEGVRLFRAIRASRPELPVILLTAWTHLETAVELVKEGAADYVAKPWEDARLLTSVRNLLDLQRAQADMQALRSERAAARSALAARHDLAGIVYASERLHVVVSMAAQVAQAGVPVLITGPNGAGKEGIADIVQANSAVRRGPYVKVNIGALPDDLIEAELFGTEAGAFTGARARPGRFEAADGGTLLLDEIGNLSASGQAKLLRVLQTGEFERLGSNQTRRVRVRVIAATNTNLRQAIREGRFREDLYFRLNVIELEVPSLAERRDDILPLARHFLDADLSLSPDAERALLRYGWPGNVRELRNTMQRAALLADGPMITAAALGLPAVPGVPPAPEEATLDRDTIEQALARCSGVVAHAARDLGLSRQALYRRMEKLGLKSTA
ncbi:MAG TPA: sigma-54 dependent transcriptional regulator [Steroidobacteraceae bacterium]|nr:sigma-54 dependent transcriptional regulator [Steroidobacteraceae bacterium]HNS26933.1 sigma-54 dependent transcriptional regulator [Steroidobacteraceae bacterium]